MVGVVAAARAWGGCAKVEAAQNTGGRAAEEKAVRGSRDRVWVRQRGKSGAGSNRR